MSNRSIRLMKVSTVCALVGLFGPMALAEDWYINEATNISDKVGKITAPGDVYVNAPVRITNGGGLTIPSGKVLYIPGQAGLCETVTVTQGAQFSLGNTGATQVKIGEKGKGAGTINLSCADGKYTFSDVDLGCLIIGGNAQANPETGFIDFLRIATGREGAGAAYRRVYTHGWQSWGSTAPARILFDLPQSTLAPKMANDGSLFKGDSTHYAWRLEGVNGADIIIAMGSWFSSNTRFNLVTPNFAMPFTTAGNCDFVICDHNASETDNRVLTLAHSTNSFHWAHTGCTVISNAATLRASADYALPNGPQTGRIELRGNNWTAKPRLDLNGTKQVVNGIYDCVGEYQGNRNAIVTNSSEAVAELIFGAHDEDSILKAGHVYERIALKKVGAGTLTVRDTRAHANDLVVEGGVVVITNCNATVALGGISVTGGRLVVDGVAVTGTSVSTSGSGLIECRNGGTLTAPNAGHVSLVIGDDTPVNHEIYDATKMKTDAVTRDLVKVGSNTVTSLGTAAYDGVDVKKGTLRVGGEFVSPSRLWKFTVTDTTTAYSFNTTNDDPDSPNRGEAITMKPDLAFGRFQLFSDGGDMPTAGMSFQGRDIELGKIEFGKFTLNMANALTYGFNSAGGYLGGPVTIFGDFKNWFVGVGFTNAAPVSAANKFELSLCLAQTAKYPAGYALASCVNYNGSRPKAWRLEYWKNNVWNLADQHSDEDACAGGSTDRFSHDDVPYLFSALSANWAFRPSGTVKVAKDATLDLSPIPAANVSIGDLTVDFAAKGGTIKNAVLASTGVLNLVGVTEALERPVDLGLTFVDSADLKNISKWIVKVDGIVEPAYRASVRSGRLYAGRPFGVVLVVR